MTAPAIRTASRAAVEASTYLSAAVEAVRLRPRPYKSCNGFQVQPDRDEMDPVRQLLALAGIGQALITLSERLGDGLADVADAVTDVQGQLGVLGDRAARRSRRPWFGRRPRRGADRLDATDLNVVIAALADAHAWRICAGDGTSPDAEDKRAAHGYLALRERLGGAS